MAQPIRATPTLKKKEANHFVEKMLKVEKRSANKLEKSIIAAIF